MKRFEAGDEAGASNKTQRSHQFAASSQKQALAV